MSISLKMINFLLETNAYTDVFNVFYELSKCHTKRFVND